MSTQTISIGRASLSLADLGFSGTAAGTSRGIVAYYPPGRVARNVYMPDSSDIDGSELIASSWQQAVLGWDWTPIGMADETELQATVDEVFAAIGQFSFTVTTQTSGAPAQIWTADRGSMALGGSDGRTHISLQTLRPVYAITIPVRPIPEVAP